MPAVELYGPGQSDWWEYIIALQAQIDALAAGGGGGGISPAQLAAAVAAEAALRVAADNLGALLSDPRFTDQRVPIDASVTPAKLSFDPALQSELDAAVAAIVVALAARADLVAGKVPTAELGGPGADATKFLRGDQSWAVPAGGGGGGGVASVAAASARIVVAGTATDPTVDVGTGIPEASIAGLVADLAGKQATIVPGTYDVGGAATAAVGTHAGLVDPHAGYRLESAPITAADVAADIATQAELDAAVAILVAVDAGKVGTGDARLSDTRTPTDTTVTPAKFAITAIDPVAGTAGARTLGAGGQQAAAGSHSHADVPSSLLDAPGDLIVASADNTPAKLAVGAAKRMLRVNPAANGLEWVDPMASIVAESHADVTVINTAAETDLAVLTLPGGSVAAGDLLIVHLWLSGLNNSGASVTYNYRLKIGATTVVTTGSVNFAASASRAVVNFVIEIMVESPTAQRVRVLGDKSGAGAAWSSTDSTISTYGVAAEDLTTTKDIKLTVQMGTASVAADMVAHASSLELVRKR